MGNALASPGCLPPAAPIPTLPSRARWLALQTRARTALGGGPRRDAGLP